ncbi:type II toxin-antitoxin system HipA family toxin [Variovorax sp. VNK109]|uniref:type II toxin-antitoxin system HipA family toxin n=1 Tax=Variovorax sp. VNK109 TaxID=3400919 RepID=UPI003BFAED79
MMAPKRERPTIEVYLDAPELVPSQQVGTLYRHDVRTDLGFSFEYAPSWLKEENAFLLDPRLELWAGEQHPPHPASAFGIFLDSAPDRWGRVLMERREAAAAEREQRPMRALQEVDFLLGVHDFTRMGALRFKEPGAGHYLDNSANAAPPVTDLRELAAISRRIEEPGVERLPEYERWLAMLIAPGTSLGGARPKANFRMPGDELWLAKFPAKDDRYDVGGWEFLVHQLAQRAGIWVPAARPEHLTDRYTTFCVARFDRRREFRRMYASAMTMLEHQDGEDGASYLGLALFLQDQGAQGHIDGDLEQLYRRVIFNVMVGNRDDHLRNHGFIREPSGWRLSPAFDVNPNLAKADHSLTFDGKSAAPSLKLVKETADFYRCEDRAQQIIDEVHTVVREWRQEAQRLGLPAIEIKRMESVFQQA